MLKKRISFLTTISVLLLTVSSLYSSSVSAAKKEPVEILSLRSEYGKHFDNGDGTITAYINSAPIHYWQNDEWVEIDNTLILDENGNYTNKSNSLNVTIPSKLSANDIADKENGVQLEYDNYALSVSLVDLPKPEKIASTSIKKNVLSSDNLVEANVIKDSGSDYSDINVPLEISDSFNDSTSSAVFESVCDNTNISVDVQPKSVIESVTFNSVEDVPDTLTYFIKADGLNAECIDTNSIVFSDNEGNDVFEIPGIAISDSSDENNSFAVDYEISNSDGGYLLNLYPTSNLDEMEEAVYPLALSTEYTVQRSVSTRYNSQASPNMIYYDSYMKIGKATNDEFQTYVSFSDSFASYGRKATILDAKFYMYINSDTPINAPDIDIYSNGVEPMNVCWNNDHSLTTYNTHVGSIEIPYGTTNAWVYADLKALTQSWLNYMNTSQWVIGLRNYGFKMIAKSYPKATVIANSERANTNKPYFIITYSKSSDYTLDYSAEKYNDITPVHNSYGNIYNFQNRMNCYAYALQVYYRGTGNYSLMPGEFGINRAPVNDIYNINSFADLENKYNYYEDEITDMVNLICRQESSNPNVYNSAQTIRSDNDFLNLMSSYSDFVEEQMNRDSIAMNYSIEKINGLSTFNLPSDFNENSERIIAMVTYFRAPNYYSGIADYHFYLRNGNGTCSAHSGNCSIWSQKSGLTEVRNTDGYNTICDQNIDECAYVFPTVQANIYLYNSNDLRYYRITKDTDVYSSYHDDGHYDSCVGTPYYDN